MSTVIGSDDLKWVTRSGERQMAFITSAIDAIGQLSIVFPSPDQKLPFRDLSQPCTAFYIGNSRAVTAGHCFIMHDLKTDRSVAAGTSCSDFKIVWARLRNQQNGSGTSECVRIESHSWVVPGGWRRAVSDYAVIVISNPPQSSLRINQSYMAPGGEDLAVVGYSEGDFLRYSVCKSVSLPNDPWTLAGFGHHQCDTIEGASGSPVFRRSTGEVIGIHTSGIDPDYDEKTNKFTPLSSVAIDLGLQLTEPADAD